MKAQWIALTWLALSVPTAVHAQPAEAGGRVRVGMTEGARLVGRLVEITPSELVLTGYRLRGRRGAQPGLRLVDGNVRIARGRVRTLERSLGDRRRFVRNFLITTGVGALALGTVSAATSHCTGQDDCIEGSGAFIVGSIAGGIISAPIGLIVGLAVHSERWEPATITLPVGASLTLTPFGAGRVALGASVRVGTGR